MRCTSHPKSFSIYLRLPKISRNARTRHPARFPPRSKSGRSTGISRRSTWSTRPKASTPRMKRGRADESCLRDVACLIPPTHQARDRPRHWVYVCDQRQRLVHRALRRPLASEHDRKVAEGPRERHESILLLILAKPPSSTSLEQNLNAGVAASCEEHRSHWPCRLRPTCPPARRMHLPDCLQPWGNDTLPARG